MAVTILVLFAPVQLAGSVGVVYAVPTNPTTTTLQNCRVRFSNTDTAPHNITGYAVPSGGSPGAGNEFFPGESLAANAHVDVDVPQLGPGGTIQAFADTASKVTILPLSGTLFS